MADDKKIIFSMVGVNKIFPPQKQVLKNIYLSFFYGAKIGIIGLNGSGKSTLLKIIAGGASPDSWFSHIAVECNPQTNKNTWLEPVSDEEYGKTVNDK